MSNFKDVASAKYKAAKQLWYKHKDTILPWYNLGREIVHAASTLPENPRIVDYVELGLLAKESYTDIFSGSKLESLMTSNGEVILFEGIIAKVIRDLIFQFAEGATVLGEEDDATAYILKMEDISIKWVEEKGICRYIACNPKDIKEVYKQISLLFRKKFPEGRVVVSANATTLIEEDKTEIGFVPLQKSNELKEYIEKFFSKDINRSILFYGPPGSGKSSLIKGIVSQMKTSTIKFSDLKNIELSLVLNIIHSFNPDCVIFEDIDHLDAADTDYILSRIEYLNSSVKLILASANDVAGLDSALIRPGRFDESVEVKYLEKEVLMKLIRSDNEANDEELYEIVKEFPVAYVKEVMKRIEALGREEALKGIGDVVTRVKNLAFDHYALERRDPVLDLPDWLQDDDDEEDFEECA